MFFFIDLFDFTAYQPLAIYLKLENIYSLVIQVLLINL